MTEHALAVKSIRCKEDCMFESRIAALHEYGEKIAYDGSVWCARCGTTWTYSRVEGGKADVHKTSRWA